MRDMDYSLHLTTACNMSCRYCTLPHGKRYMAFETARAVLDRAARAGGVCGIELTGGEPLLQKQLIEEIIRYGFRLMRRGRVRFDFKISTNGLLLDEEMIRFAAAHDVTVALYHDGIRAAHDKNRVSSSRSGTFANLEPVIDALLAVMPYSPVHITVEPSVVSCFADSVAYLYERGFRVLLADISIKGRWNSERIAQLQKQYLRLSRFYFERTLNGDTFYFAPFETKMQSCIQGGCTCLDRCEFGKSRISVSTCGDFYPCGQFIGNKQYQIGSIRTGLDDMRRFCLYRKNGSEKTACADCPFKSRCRSCCGCRNFTATGSVDRVSPLVCAHERALIPITDDLAKRLLRNRYATFLHKPYDEFRSLVPAEEASAHGMV